jgi:GR25 family glycosyltransferase involved in LPS biosynthesis
VINLDRHVDRLAAFQRWNAGCGFSIERFPAADGYALDEATRRTLATSDRYAPGMLGNSLSHKRLWERTIQSAEPMIIFEDDAVLRADFSTVLPPLIGAIQWTWDIVLLGVNTNSVLYFRAGQALPKSELRFGAHPTVEELVNFQTLNEEVELARLANAFGICGYAISPHGAERLLKLCFPMDDRVLAIEGIARPVLVSSLDGMMNSFYADLDAYVCWPPLVLSPNDQATSSTRGRSS